MDIPKIHEGEYRFCLILWKHCLLYTSDAADE